ncbi:hypothetical protein [Sedimenticola sp.]|uniref:hypothetical protein n=1 Tax=Sedimenticola sp. TaxID=1940285 RepID=UPI003D128810
MDRRGRSQTGRIAGEDPGNLPGLTPTPEVAWVERFWMTDGESNDALPIWEREGAMGMESCSATLGGSSCCDAFEAPTQ